MLNNDGPHELAAAIGSRLGFIQRQPALIAGLLGQTGLTLESQPAMTARLSAAVAGVGAQPRLTLADGEDKLAGAAVSALLPVQGAAGRLKPALLRDPD